MTLPRLPVRSIDVGVTLRVAACPTDAELVHRCLEARDAFDELYRRHAPAVYAFLRSLNRGDEHAAQDALQETFFRAYRALARFDTKRPLRPWLFTIAWHASADARRKSRRVRVEAPEVVGELAKPAPGPTAEEKATAEDAWSRIASEAGERLLPRQLATFLLARSQGLSYGEIAEMHDVSVATVKRDLREALEVLAGTAARLGFVT